MSGNWGYLIKGPASWQSVNFTLPVITYDYIHNYVICHTLEFYKPPVTSETPLLYAIYQILSSKPVNTVLKHHTTYKFVVSCLHIMAEVDAFVLEAPQICCTVCMKPCHLLTTSGTGTRCPNHLTDVMRTTNGTWLMKANLS
jgi:hypothetical protein